MMVMVSRNDLEKILKECYGEIKESIGAMFGATITIPERFKYSYTYMEIILDIWSPKGQHLDSFLVFKENATGNLKYLVDDSKF